MRMRRALTLVVATFAVLMMFGGTAFAHFCYVANRSDQGNANAGRSPAWVSLEEILVDEFGLCQEGAEHVEEVYLAPRGASLSTLLHEKALLAGGRFGTEHTRNGKGVDHLFSSDEDFDAIFEAIDEGFAICAG